MTSTSNTGDTRRPAEHQDDVAREFLLRVRDRVLDHAEPLGGTTLLDLWAGDGLISLAALERVGATGTVVLSDVSAEPLEDSRAAVVGSGMAARARFVETEAEDLAAVADASVDVVTARAVLAHVAEPASVLTAMHRVLTRGGRISLFEPIERLTTEPRNRLLGYDVAAVPELADRVKAMLARYRPPLTLDDLDLVHLAEAAGFQRIHLRTHLDAASGPLRGMTLDTLLESAPAPNAPTVRLIIEEALDRDERSRLLAHLRAAGEANRHLRRIAGAYLVAYECA